MNGYDVDPFYVFHCCRECSSSRRLHSAKRIKITHIADFPRGVAHRAFGSALVTDTSTSHDDADVPIEYTLQAHVETNTLTCALIAPVALVDTAGPMSEVRNSCGATARALLPHLAHDYSRRSRARMTK
jgi:hypothetical protein